MWPHIFLRVVAALILFQVTMFGYLGSKEFVYAPFLIIPLIIISLIFAFIIDKKFYRSFCNTALEAASHDLKETPNMEHIFRSYIPKSLSSEKLDEYQFDDALSHVSRTESSV